MDKAVIDKIFEDLLNSYWNTKCSLSDLRADLSKMSEETKDATLIDKLNEAEWDYYKYLKKEKKNLDEIITEHENEDADKYPKGMIESLLKEFRKSRKELDDALFNLERKIFDKTDDTGKDNVNVDLKKYNIEKDNVDEDSLNVSFGKIEQGMINAQRNVDFNEGNINALTSYYSDGYALLNSKLNNGKQWNKLTKDAQDYHAKKLNTMSRELSDAINKTDGLSEPTRLYHNGVFDVSQVVGGRIKFNGFTSASFQKHVATDWTGTYNGVNVNYTYELLCDTGTKGVCANDSSHGTLTHMSFEHEYLLDKGLEGDIVNIDVENHIVTVLVD